MLLGLILQGENAMAGEVVARVSRSLSVGGITVGGTAQTVMADYPQGLQKTIPGGTTNAEFDIAIDVSTVKAVGIETNHDATVKTNSTSVPDDTLALIGGVAMIWVTGDVASNFLTVDVTKLYVTIPGSVETLFKLTLVGDSTPVLI